MRVHVVLRNLPATAEDVEGVVRQGRLTGVDESRARRFGIVTGDMPDDYTALREGLLALPAVSSVEVDGTKRTS